MSFRSTRKTALNLSASQIDCRLHHAFLKTNEYILNPQHTYRLKHRKQLKRLLFLQLLY